MRLALDLQLVRRVGRPSAVLIREGWEWDDVIETAALGLLMDEAEADAARGDGR